MIKAIVYTSNAGHTKKYAELLGHETELPVYDLKTAKKELQKDQPVIYLGWLMAGNVKGYKKAKKYFTIKALCGVGMAANGSQIADIRKTNEIPEGLPVFNLQGGFELEKLHGLYRFMMATMAKTVGKKLAQKQEKTPEEEEMLAMMQSGANTVCPDNLADVIGWYTNERSKT